MNQNKGSLQYLAANIL